MSRILAAALPAALLLTLAACGSGGDTATEPAGFDASAWTAEGAAALQPFQQALMGALMNALPDGPEAAIEACRLQAPGLPDRAAGATWTLGRTSHRLRNPDNAPEPWMAPLLEAYRTDSARTAPTALRLDDGAVGYVQPIRVQGLCLTCHGTDLLPSVSAALAAAYPGDEATGFAEGAFRGLFWVRFAPEHEPGTLARPAEAVPNPHG